MAASLRLADLLKDGPRTSEDLAQATGTHARSLYRLLRALAAARVFEEHPDRRFALAPMGEYLRSDLANSRRAWAELIGRPYVRQSWSALEDTVRTGETAFRRLYGTGIWDWRSEKPEERAIFDAAMTGLSRMAAHAVADAYDFSDSTCVVDVGGGQGALLAEILSRHAQLKGILFDLPSVVAGARPVLEEAGVADRCQALPT
ncbi:MAG: methyltransferase [Hyphomicrobiaceae bacterium]